MVYVNQGESTASSTEVVRGRAPHPADRVVISPTTRSRSPDRSSSAASSRAPLSASSSYDPTTTGSPTPTVSSDQPAHQQCATAQPHAAHHRPPRARESAFSARAIIGHRGLCLGVLPPCPTERETLARLDPRRGPNRQGRGRRQGRAVRLRGSKLAGYLWATADKGQTLDFKVALQQGGKTVGSSSYQVYVQPVYVQ